MWNKDEFQEAMAEDEDHMIHRPDDDIMDVSAGSAAFEAYFEGDEEDEEPACGDCGGCCECLGDPPTLAEQSQFDTIEEKIDFYR